MTLDALLKLDRTLIMGVLNVTPDSFFDGGKYPTSVSALKRAEEMIAQGADIIDIGGESTRPGAQTVDEKEETRRVAPVIEQIAKKFPGTVISVDTCKSGVAKTALDSGATVINDISGLTFSPDMVKIAAEKNAHVIIMHIKGTPKDMQANPEYADVIVEIRGFLEKQAAYAVSCGVKKEKILIDPGIGFGKTTRHNIEILRKIKSFNLTGFPVVLGTSRKSFIGKILGSEKEPIPLEARLPGSLATYAWAVLNGIKVLRVHDVKETSQFLGVFDRIRETI
ncbi:MAG: dihydropteroate synthase [Elusimicrobia bacterium RIFOXYB2_FULL_48_7]|nr:MAG: dihydropteroate synthase [Elusimicrobia bacterium RIFOXYB2_FULL_48_7]